MKNGFRPEANKSQPAASTKCAISAVIQPGKVYRSAFESFIVPTVSLEKRPADQTTRVLLTDCREGSAAASRLPGTACAPAGSLAALQKLSSFQPMMPRQKKRAKVRSLSFLQFFGI
jgi:hypothetical protein